MSTFATYKAQVKLLPGQTLAFQKGKGYYAKGGSAPQPYAGGGPAEPKSGGGGNPYAPKAPLPTATPPGGGGDGKGGGGKRTPPVDPYGPRTQAEIDALAGQQAQAGLTPQQDEVRRQQALAAAAAKADEGAIQGFQTAASGMISGLAPDVQAAYAGAAHDEAALGQGMATGVGNDISANEAAAQAFAQSQGQSGGHTVDPNAAHDVIFGLNGQIPADSFLEQGAAARTYQDNMALVPLDAGSEQLDARMAQARVENDGYAQQLISLAAQYPGLKAQALQQLNQYELDKANYREGLVNDAATRRVNQQNADTSARSEHAQEVASGITAAGKSGELSYKWASLNFKTQQAADAAKKAAAQGHQIDASASKAVGYLIGKDGKPVLDANGQRIKVVQGSSTAQTKAINNRYKATSKARVTAAAAAAALIGKPVVNKNQGAFGGKGRFIADPRYASIPPGKPGAVYHTNYGQPGDIATTDRPGRASHTGGNIPYAQAQAKVWAAIDGDGLMAQYNLSREQVMKWVNQALITAGFRRSG